MKAFSTIRIEKTGNVAECASVSVALCVIDVFTRSSAGSSSIGPRSSTP